MPYVITTATPWGRNLGARDRYAVTSRRAVATLDEARDRLYDALRDIPIEMCSDDAAVYANGLMYASADTMLRGYTVTALSGHVVVVAPVEWRDIDAPFMGEGNGHMVVTANERQEQQIIDAYNASFDKA